MPGKQVKKKPVAETPKEGFPGLGLLDQILGIFKKKVPAPHRHAPQREQPIPPP